MPTLTGKTLDDAKAMLDSYGLTLADTQEEESEEYPVGQVLPAVGFQRHADQEGGVGRPVYLDR